MGPTLFVTVFTLEGWLRPGYDSTRMFVSALSLGPRGSIQIVNFVVVGISFLLLARGLAEEFPDGRASRAGPALLAIVGLGHVASGPFVMDAGAAPFSQMSWHGQIHNVLGAVVFSLAPVSCFVWFRRFRVDPSWRPMAAWTLVAGLVITTAVVLLKVATLPPPPNVLNGWAGAIQRVAIVTLMSWVVTLGVALRTRATT